jgi:hypothetical protein
MKNIIAIILAITVFSNLALADNCDWSTIKAMPNGDFEYSPQLNLCVGNLVQQNQVQTQQLSDLNQAIDLKNLALQNADARTALWEKTSDDELSRINKIESDSKQSGWLMFALGAGTVILSGFMAAKLVHN